MARGTLRVRHQLGRDGKLAEPKTQKSKRVVDLAAQLVAWLRAHKLATPWSQPGDFVFPAWDGSGMHYSSAARKLRKAVKRAGLNVEGLPTLRWHDLRHTAASIQIAAGVDVRSVSAMLGHSSPSITLDVYTHEFDGERHSQRRRAAMDAVLAGSNRVAQHTETGGNGNAAEDGKHPFLHVIQNTGK